MNVLSNNYDKEINVVLADGSLVTANQARHSECTFKFFFLLLTKPPYFNIVFWAMRGGGAGSWGIIVSATFKTFPTFNVTVNNMIVVTNDTDTMAQVAMVHAKHIFDWDSFRVGQYFYLTLTNVTGSSTPGVATMLIATYFPNTSPDEVTTALQPFITDMQAIPGVTVEQASEESEINAVLFSADDSVGADLVLGSRLVPADAYTSPETVGKVYKQLLDGGATKYVQVFVVKIQTNICLLKYSGESCRRWSSL